MPALGGGEPSIVPIPAAIANAIFDATGVRLREVPFTPERVLAAMRAGATVDARVGCRYAPDGNREEPAFILPGGG